MEIVQPPTFVYRTGPQQLLQPEAPVCNVESKVAAKPAMDSTTSASARRSALIATAQGALGGALLCAAGFSAAGVLDKSVALPCVLLGVFALAWAAYFAATSAKSSS